METQTKDSVFGAWSVSKLKVLQKCPLQYYLKYHLKYKYQASEVQDMTITEVGKAAHSILENVILGTSIQDSYKKVKEKFTDTLPEDTWNELVLSLEANVYKFSEKMEDFRQSNPIKRVLPEIRAAVDKDWNSTGFFSKDVYFRGVMDLSLQLENGDVVIIDHKTGGNPAFGIRNYQFQLDTYKLLFHHGINPITGAQSGIHFIREGDIVLGEYSTKEEIETKIKNDVYYSIDSAVTKVFEDGYFKHKRGSMCKYCEYDELCRNKQYKQFEDDSGKLIYRLKDVSNTEEES